jgi:chaperonin GroEL
VLYGEAARAALVRGMDLMAALMCPTLGPVGRTVAITRLDGRGPPEILDDATTIGRRTIQLPDPFEDMGAMIIRHLVGQVFERAGDGAATAAVLARALVYEAQRCIAAGSNPQRLKRGIECGLPLVAHHLRSQAWRIEEPAEIVRLAEGIVGEVRSAEMLGEILDSVGPDGAVLVENAEATETGYAYVDGLRWNEGIVSSYFLEAGQTIVRLLEPRIFVTDRTVERAEQLLPVLEACAGAGERNLVVIAPEVRDAAVALLLANRGSGALDAIIALKAPSLGAQRTRILEDIAVATGGRCIREEAGDSFEAATIEDLGQARQVWASRGEFGILGGQGERAAIRQRIAAARAELADSEDDRFLRDKIRERIGKLSGAGAIVRVGAPTESARDELKLRIEAALATLRLALQEGVVSGGGAALLGAAAGLDSLKLSGDEAMGATILARALAEPMRAIAANAGCEPEAVVDEARRRGPDWMFDVVRGRWLEARKAGLVDALAVVQTVLEASASAGMMAMSIEALVRRRDPLARYRPPR